MTRPTVAALVRRTATFAAAIALVAAGLSEAGIGVETDSDQGARPYLALGYQPVDTMVWYVNHVSLGTILSAQADEADGA